MCGGLRGEGGHVWGFERGGGSYMTAQYCNCVRII